MCNNNPDNSHLGIHAAIMELVEKLCYPAMQPVSLFYVINNIKYVFHILNIKVVD